MTIEDKLLQMATHIPTSHEREVAIAAFVARAQKLPMVEQVLVVGDHAVLTVISAPPFDNDAFYPVLDLQADVMHEFGVFTVNFDIINLTEYEDGIETMIPVGARTAFNKKGSPA